MAQGTCEGAQVLRKHDRWGRGLTTRPPSGPPQRHQGAKRGPTDPQQPLGPHLLRCVGGRALQARHQVRSRSRPHLHVPDGEGVAAPLPLQYGDHLPWVHTVDAEVILHLLQHADRGRATGVPAGAAKVVNQMPLR